MLDNVDKWLKIRIVGGFLVIVVLWLVPGRQIPAILESNSKRSVIEEQIAEAQSWREITSKIRQQNQLLLGKLDRLYLETPENEVLSAIVAFIQHSGREANVELTAIKPAESVLGDASQEIPFFLSVTGKFTGIGKFINLLETSQYVLSIKHLDLNTADMTTNTIDCTIELVVFQVAVKADMSKRINS
jgi:Tfp pilus assembly protein PilO